jgi:hypothetical protein
VKFGKLFSKRASRAQLAKRVESLFARPEQRSPEYTFGHLLQKVQPSTPEDLVLVLAELANTHVIEKVIRVESPDTRGGIADFSSYEDIPLEIYDHYTNRTLEVQPAYLTVIFRRGPEVGKHVG